MSKLFSIKIINECDDKIEKYIVDFAVPDTYTINTFTSDWKSLIKYKDIKERINNMETYACFCNKITLLQTFILCNTETHHIVNDGKDSYGSL